MRPAALAKSLVEIPFEGLDRKTNAKLVLPGNLLKLENGRFFESKTIRKRNGYTKIGQGVLGASALAAGNALARYRDELLLFNAGTLYTYSTALAQWVSRGGVTPFSARRQMILGNQSTVTNPDTATTGGVTVFAWTDSRGGVRASVVDEETGATFLSDVLIETGAVRPRCVAIGRFLHVLYVSGTDLKSRRVDTLSPSAFIAATTLAANVVAAAGEQHLDVIVLKPTGAAQASAFFAYHSTGGVSYGYLLETGVVGDPANGGLPSMQTTASTATLALTIDGSAAHNGVHILWANGTGLRDTVVAADTLVAGVITLIDAATDVANVTVVMERNAEFNGRAYVFCERSAAAPTNHTVYFYRLDGSGGLEQGPVLVRRSVGLASKAWLHGGGAEGANVPGTAYVVLVFAGTLQSTYFVSSNVVIADPVVNTIIGRLFSQNAGGLQVGAVPSVVAKSANEFFWPAPVKTRFVSEANVTYSRVGVAKSSLSFADAGQYQGVQAGESLVIPGGMVSLYDGAGVVEAGFHVFPELLAGVTQNAAGGSMAGTGRYAFTWIYEWYDAKGQIHRSAPAVPVLVDVPAGTATNRCSFAVPTLRLTTKTSPHPEARIICYSTAINGTVFYRTPHQAGTATEGVENNPAADTVSFERTVADASITTNEILYSQGTAGPDSGELPNLCPPSARLVAVGKGRVILAGLENPRGWMYSKRTLNGRAPEFSDFLQGPDLPDDITAVEVLDDKVIFFARDAIFVLAGDGPDNLGQNDTFLPPQALTSDVGCIEPRSVASTPGGIVFQSAKGIHLLSRGLAVSYLGAPVEAYNSQTIVAATVVDDRNEVRFLTDAGETLVFDYHVGQWATWTNHTGKDAVLFGNVYHYLRSDGAVYREAAGVYTDDGLPVRMKLRTAWLKPGSIQGYKRIWRLGLLGDFYADHTLTGRVYFDYRAYHQDEFDWVPGDVFDVGVFGDGNFGDGDFGGDDAEVRDRVYQLRHHMKRQKCEAISVEIEDGGDAGGGFSIASLALEVGILPGIHRMPAAKTV